MKDEDQIVQLIGPMGRWQAWIDHDEKRTPHSLTGSPIVIYT